MFRKLISNLPFSPALVHDVGFYAKRLRKEEVTRRFTVLFVVLALIMQSLAVFSAPESANASSEQDIIRGGVSSLEDFLLRYDHNEDDLKDIFDTLGVTKAEIANAKPSRINTNRDTHLLTRYGQLNAASNEVGLSYQKSAGGTGIRYFSPLLGISAQPHSYDGWEGSSTAIGWFAIMKTNGGLVTQGLPSNIDPVALGTPAATKTITATNLTNGDKTSTVAAQPLDKIAYTIKATNSSPASLTSPLSVNIADILEYTRLIDSGGGTYDTKTGALTWPSVQLTAAASQERVFVVQLLSEIPATASGQSNPASYDCTLTAVFGTRLQTPVSCPPAKAAESLFSQLPTTGIVANVVFAAVLLLTVIYFYARTRQLKSEIRIIRHNMNVGII